MLTTSSIRRATARSFVASKGWSSPTHGDFNRWFSAVPSDGDTAAPAPEEKPPVVGATTKGTEVSPTADELKNNLKPSEIVQALDRHIVGQKDAKKAVAIAMRNRWRRRQLPEELRKEVTPRNVLLVGPTGTCVFSHILLQKQQVCMLTIFSLLVCFPYRLR
jgi:hypothetical protein